MRSHLPLVGLALLLLAGCAVPQDDRPREEPPPGEKATFPEGIYYRTPLTASPAAALSRIGGGAPGATLPPGGFDLRPDLLVSPHPEGLLLVDARGRATVLPVPGLHAIARPSLSPDGTRALVQATTIEPRGGPSQNLDVFVVNLSTGAFERVSDAPENDESPEWFPDGTRVAYSTFSPETGVTLRVRDLAARREVLAVPDAGAIHLAVSRDGARVLEPGRARILNASTGEILADLRAALVAAAAQAGYVPDERFQGQANRGTFPLDGDFSPDGRFLVFDGAVRRGAEHGVVLFRVAADGSGFEVLTPLLPADPSFSNGHNYSQTNPRWI
ncbi:MAG TPA: hypothetical protein VM681_10215 [Candidatus Thermoplasmatota archaeon]|nr:hypothetical protein [Candidatus Thermoplasmatota archaeon]